MCLQLLKSSRNLQLKIFLRERLDFGKNSSKRNICSFCHFIVNKCNLINKESKSVSICRSNKIFKQMSNFIGSRDGIQCRSHHMKQLRTHKQIKRILLHYGQ